MGTQTYDGKKRLSIYTITNAVVSGLRWVVAGMRSSNETGYSFLLHTDAGQTFKVTVEEVS